MNLHELLLKKATSDGLGHFYILETSSAGSSAHENLLKFTHTFIKDYFRNVEGHKQELLNLADHPDVFVLGNTTETEDEKNDKFFKVEEAEALNRFFEFKPVQSKRKFAVITEGHRINTIVANKWLKLLEEPQGVSTIFLLNPRGGQLLPTIHSRAIHLRLPGEKIDLEFSAWIEMMKDIKEMGLSQFLDTYARGQENLGFWVNELIKWESEQINSASSKERLNSWLKTYQEMETFHQPSATKWTLFHSYLVENILPRMGQL